MAVNLKRTLVRITHDGKAADLDVGQQPASDVMAGIGRLINFLAGVISGVRSAKVEVAPDAVQATGTATAGTANGTVVVNGVSVAGNGADATARAADAATNINASADPLIAGHVTATAASGVVTITAMCPGKAGNAITLSVTGTGWSASGARLTGGTESFKAYTKGV